jgi:hypothetical protein
MNSIEAKLELRAPRMKSGSAVRTTTTIKSFISKQVEIGYRWNPQDPKNRDKIRVKKKGGEKKGQKTWRKTGKDNRTVRHKKQKGVNKKKLTKNNKREGTEDQDFDTCIASFHSNLSNVISLVILMHVLKFWIPATIQWCLEKIFPSEYFTGYCVL